MWLTDVFNLLFPLPSKLRDRKTVVEPSKENDCICCELGMKEICPHSEKECGHHCNHSWSHDRCCWCGKEWGEEIIR